MPSLLMRAPNWASGSSAFSGLVWLLERLGDRQAYYAYLWLA